MDEALILQIERELAAIAKQILKVEMNAVAVETAIAGRGTYRGYSGEDVFLKNNLRVVQKEMIKQLRRKERNLKSRKYQLITKGTANSGEEGNNIRLQVLWFRISWDCEHLYDGFFSTASERNSGWSYVGTNSLHSYDELFQVSVLRTLLLNVENMRY